MAVGDIYANTAFSGSITPSVAVVNPVQNNGTADLVNSIDGGLKQANQLFGAAIANKDKAANSQVLVNFQDDVSKITDAMETGMSVQEGRMRLRALNSQYLANYPTLQKDINDLQGKLVSTVGLANVIATGNEQTQGDLKLQQEAITKGWPDITSYKAHLSSVNQLEITKTNLDQQVAEYGIMTQKDTTDGYRALQGVIKTGLKWVNNKIDDYQNLVNSGQMKPEDAIAALNAEVSKETATIGAIEGTAGNANKDADPSFLLKGIQDRLKAFTDYNNGTIAKDTYQNQLATSEAIDQLAIRTKDPVLGRMLTLSKTIPAIAQTGIMSEMNDRVLEYFTNLEQNGAPDPLTGAITSAPAKPQDVITTDKDMGTALDATTAAIKNIGSSPSPEQKAAVTNSITNVLAGVKTFGSTASSPVEFKNVIEMLADPAVGGWMAKNGGVPQKAAQDAAYVVQQQYGEVLLPLVKQRWDEAQAMISSLAPDAKTNPMRSAVQGEDVNAVVMPVWNGGAVEFQPAPGFEKDAKVVSLVKSLNSGPNSIAGPLNTYIRAATHMQGSTNYQSFYTSNIKDRLFYPDKGNDRGTSARSNEPLSDFASDVKPGDTGTGNSIGEQYYKSIRAAESSGNDSAVNPSSGATGRYQFTSGTWNDLARSFPGLGLTRVGGGQDGRTDPAQQEKAIKTFTRLNAASLEDHHIPVNNGTLYASHFLGRQAAPNVLLAPDDDLVANHVPPSYLIQNKFLRGMTIGEFKQWAASHSRG